MKQNLESIDRHKLLSSKILDMVYSLEDKDMFAHQVVCVIQLMGGWRANLEFGDAMRIGELVYDRYEGIKDGTMDFDELVKEVYDTTSQGAVSALSKVYHIINPKAHPFIMDSHLTKLFGCTMKSKYSKFLELGKKYCLSHGYSYMEIGTYTLDSKIWRYDIDG